MNNKNLSLLDGNYNEKYRFKSQSICYFLLLDVVAVSQYVRPFYDDHRCSSSLAFTNICNYVIYLLH